MRYIAIALMLVGCQTRSAGQVVTANECRTACYPNAMSSVEVRSGLCKCHMKVKR